MARSFSEPAPDRVEILDGGGCLSLFGLPFLGAGVFVWLLLLGVVPTSNGAASPWYAVVLLGVMGVVFVVAGGILVFGRAWTVVDASRRELVSERGLLVPLQRTVTSLGDAVDVRLGFTPGDSDTADEYSIAVRTRDGASIAVASFPGFAMARACAARVAILLQLPLEEATSDHPHRLTTRLLDASFRERVRAGGLDAPSAEPPPVLRSQVTQDGDRVCLRIPNPPMSPLAVILTLIPVAVPVIFAPALSRFFLQTRTPSAIGWAFIGFLVLLFGVLPATSAIRSALVARFGATLVTVSPEALVIEIRGITRIAARTAIPAADIVDLDVSTPATRIAAARDAADQRVAALQREKGTTVTAGPMAERMVGVLGRLARGRGVIVKSRGGVTTFGSGLPEDEARYLHAILWRALNN